MGTAGSRGTHITYGYGSKLRTNDISTDTSHTKERHAHATRSHAGTTTDAAAPADTRSEKPRGGGQRKGRRRKNDRCGEPGAGTGEDGARGGLAGRGRLRPERADHAGHDAGA